MNRPSRIFILRSRDPLPCWFSPGPCTRRRTRRRTPRLQRRAIGSGRNPCGDERAGPANRARTRRHGSRWKNLRIRRPRHNPVARYEDRPARRRRRFSSPPRGTASYPSADSQGQPKTQSFGAAGLARGWRDLVHQYPVANSGHGALIGRIGSSDGSQPFAIGESQKSDIPVPGRLFLGLNQGTKEAATAQGSFHVTIAVLNAGTGIGKRAVFAGHSGQQHHLRSSRKNSAARLRPLRQSRRHGQHPDRRIAGRSDRRIQGRRLGAGGQFGGQHDSERRAGHVFQRSLPDHAHEPALSFRPRAGLWLRARRARESGRIAQSSPRLEISVRSGRASGLVHRRHARHRLRARPAQQRTHAQNRSRHRRRARIRERHAFRARAWSFSARTSPRPMRSPRPRRRPAANSIPTGASSSSILKETAGAAN